MQSLSRLKIRRFRMESERRDMSLLTSRKKEHGISLERSSQ